MAVQSSRIECIKCTIEQKIEPGGRKERKGLVRGRRWRGRERGRTWGFLRIGGGGTGWGKELGHV